MNKDRLSDLSLEVVERRRVPSTVAHVAGLALLWVSAGVAISAVVEFLGDGDDVAPLLGSTALMAALGFFLWAPTAPGRTDSATIFATVAWTWLFVSIVGAAPYLLADTFLRWDDALFESISGFSCTGSTVFGGDNPTIEAQGPGLLLYRSMTQWFGGMGIVVLAVAVLPFLGVGGLSLISAEAPGPGSDRLAPRVSETARKLWLLYAGVTGAIALVLWIVPGPTLYDAINYGFTTASTGGFAPHDASAGNFDSIWVEGVLIVGMIIGGASFTLHWNAIRGDLGVYRRTGEFHTYIKVLAGAMAALVLLLWIFDDLPFDTAFRAGVFNATTLGTSTGFGNATEAGSPGDFLGWMAATHVVLLFLMAFGGMTGSTSGGAKVFRFHIGISHIRRTIRKARHPRAVLPMKIGDTVVPDGVAGRVVGFMFLYTALALGGWMVLAFLDTEPTTALGGSFSALGNMGPALGDVGPVNSFVEGFTRPARGVLMFLMVAGRLEVFPVLLMFVAPLRSVQRRL